MVEATTVRLPYIESLFEGSSSFKQVVRDSYTLNSFGLFVAADVFDTSVGYKRMHPENLIHVHQGNVLRISQRIIFSPSRY